MSSVPMPRDLSEVALRKWVRALAECDLPAKDCRSCQQTARAVRALLREKVREAVVETAVIAGFDAIREDRLNAIVSRVLGEEAPRA